MTALIESPLEHSNNDHSSVNQLNDHFLKQGF